jgi:multimeric flavodoxin WrbA
MVYFLRFRKRRMGMRIIVLSSSPNTDGLTAACARAAIDGSRREGAQASEIRINDADIGMCKACDNGWGTCRDEHRCKVEDGFQPAHQAIVESDALVLVTPVYWGEMSESAKALTDRLRRCEATAGGKSRLQGKPVIAVAAAGDSGNGVVSCLASMERLIQHVGAQRFDMISVNRWNREYKLSTIGQSAAAMARGMR